MLFRLLILVTFLVAISCSFKIQETTEYQVETYYGRSGDGLPIQYFSFSLDD